MLAFQAKTGLRYMETDKEKSAKVDGVLVRDKEIIAAAETKVREMSESDLKDFGTYLISNEKIEKGKIVAELFQVPYVISATLSDSGVMYVWRVIDEDGNPVFDYEVENRKTQKTVNGGEKIDEVALLPVEHGKKFDLDVTKILNMKISNEE